LHRGVNRHQEIFQHAVRGKQALKAIASKKLTLRLSKNNDMYSKQIALDRSKFSNNISLVTTLSHGRSTSIIIDADGDCIL